MTAARIKNMKVLFIGGDRMKLAHGDCVSRYNSTIACGADHGDCGSPACALSERYAGPPANDDERRERVATLKGAAS